MHTLKNTHIVPYCSDLLDIVSTDILKRYGHLLPDMRAITIFLPSHLAFKPLYKKIIQHAVKYGHQAVLLPHCTTLRKWVLSRHMLAKVPLSQYACELILVDSINQQPGVFASANPWIIANELLSLFDAMLLNNIDLSSIQHRFNKHNEDAHASYALSQEANLVATLWLAWQQQLSKETMQDPVATYVQALQRTTFSKQEIYFAVGLDDLTKQEKIFFEKMAQQAQLHIFLHASDSQLSAKPDLAIRNHVDNHTIVDQYMDAEIFPYSKFLHSVFIDNGPNIKQRAENFYATHSISPVSIRLKTYKTNSFERHVKAIDIKIRSCLYENKNNIAVVTADRKLVRRLRAILEHANVCVNDLGGWALSTTSAVVVIELWLQLIEEKYSAKHFLNLAKSPFFPMSVEKYIHDQAITFFEKNVILAFNLHNGLHLFRDKLEQLEAKQEINANIFNYLYRILERFEAATHNLAKLRQRKSVPMHHFFTQLINSLKAFGFYSILIEDDAGEQMINLFESQITNFHKIENNTQWSEWRRFLTRILDQQNFKPSLIKSNVTFCNLEQSRLLKFDALIIASVDKDHFPGTSVNYTFFNEDIRSELGIPTWRDEHARYFYLFRMLLEAAPDVLVTFQTERNGEKTTPCPWLEAIEMFHSMAYQDDLFDQALQALVELEDTGIISAQRIAMPSLTLQPSPVLAENLKPDSISISHYQLLMNCPYQFFAAACLGLSPANELSEELDKSDFGNLIHKCIYAFNVNVPSLPGPFTERITTNNHEAAIAMLSTISKQVFEQSTARGFSDQLWIQHWLNLIPKFIDWEILRQNDYAPYKHEVSIDRNINATTSLKGRIDRVDKSAEGYAIIDYKTGQTPPKKNVLAGEQVQLPTYAVLSENCKQVEYVTIGKDNEVKSEVIIRDDQLQELIQAHQQRLTEFANTLNNEIRLTALADDDICKKCQVKGLCRKDYWQC